ncbi:MAG: hypothetical protein PWP17_911 [Desulfomicrobiaceae bacterium]|nr:hypothetical protein [Desulfomicrobiaceae bacterium]
MPQKKTFLQAAYPWSGQEDCFDARGHRRSCAASGEDGALRPGRPWPRPRFRVDGSVVWDLLTGLAWPQDASVGAWPMTWAEARAWVAAQNASRFLGCTDWRLPRRRELLSLVSLAHARPALPPGHPFAGVFGHWHWTATAAATGEGDFWRVHLEGGRMFPGHGSDRCLVLPVRERSWLPAESPDEGQRLGRPWPQPRWVPGPEGVQDALTGLRWLFVAQSDAVSWQEALDRARGMPGWRLPSIWELETLVDTSRAFPALGVPLAAAVDGVWSSTSSGYDPAWAWVLYCGKGAVGVGHKPRRDFQVLLVAE